MDLIGHLVESRVASMGQRPKLSFVNLLILADGNGDAFDVRQQLLALHALAATRAKLAVEFLDLVSDVDDVREAEQASVTLDRVHVAEQRANAIRSQVSIGG